MCTALGMSRQNYYRQRQRRQRRALQEEAVLAWTREERQVFAPAARRRPAAGQPRGRRLRPLPVARFQKLSTGAGGMAAAPPNGLHKVGAGRESVDRWAGQQRGVILPKIATESGLSRCRSGGGAGEEYPVAGRCHGCAAGPLPPGPAGWPCCSGCFLFS